jgi:ParB family transcriptional regulator, chromosome partitioning protein
MFEIPASGRRYRALELLVKQKRLAKSAPIPCVVRNPATDILGEDDSLAENIERAPLHHLDQFRAFHAMREKGQAKEDIAAAFFVGVNVVKQRLRLAAVSEKLLDVYAEDGMSLEQLIAFTVTADHAWQEQVWEALQRSYSREPYQIRRMLSAPSARRTSARSSSGSTPTRERRSSTRRRACRLYRGRTGDDRGAEGGSCQARSRI